MKTMHESIKSFLAAKGIITSAQAEMPGFPPVVELGYKSFAQHRCGIQPPIDIPINLEQVPPQILDDADWVWLGDVSDETAEAEEDQDTDEGNVESDEDEGDDEDSTENSVPESNVLPVAEPVTTPTMETGEPVQAAAPAAPVADANTPPADQVSELSGEGSAEGADDTEDDEDEEEEDDEEGTDEGDSDEDGDDLDGANDESDDIDKE